MIEFQNAIHSVIMVFLSTFLKRNILPYYTDQFVSPFVNLLAPLCAKRCWPASSICHLREPLATKINVFVSSCASGISHICYTVYSNGMFIFIERIFT